MKVLNSGNTVGNTTELRELSQSGKVIRSAFGDFVVLHCPRSKNDPTPWVSHNGNGFRYSSRECYAERSPEPTMAEYAMAARFISGLIPNGRNVARNKA